MSNAISRRYQRSVNERQRAELFCHRIPRGRGEETKTEFLMAASEDPTHSSHPIRMTSTTTADAIASVSHSNALSPNRDGGAMRCCAGLSVIGTEAANAIIRNRQPERLLYNGRPLATGYKL